MISSNYIPEKISEYNAYLDGSKMIGVAASVTLPEINMKTSTVSGQHRERGRHQRRDRERVRGPV